MLFVSSVFADLHNVPQLNRNHSSRISITMANIDFWEPAVMSKKAGLFDAVPCDRNMIAMDPTITVARSQAICSYITASKYLII